MEFPVYARMGPEIVSGCGYRVADADGNEYLDLYGGHAVASLGYRHPRWTAAIARQAERLGFQTNAVDLPVREQAVRALVQAAMPGLDAVLLVNSGAEAIENALRLAFRKTGRSKVAALRGSFHGRTAAAAAVTWGSADWYGFPTAPFETVWVEPNNVASLDQALDDTVAAFLYEPVQGVAGAVALDAEFVTAAIKLCRERGAASIADEVQTGMGRCGAMFASELLGPAPDLMTLAKGLGGGFPVAAVLAPKDWTADLPIGSFGTTFGGGPIACAAILAVLGELQSPGFLDSVRHSSRRLADESPGGVVESVTGLGLLLGLRCRRPAAQVRRELLARGILTGDAKDPAVVRLLPPLTIDDDAIDEFLTALGSLPS